MRASTRASSTSSRPLIESLQRQTSGGAIACLAGIVGVAIASFDFLLTLSPARMELPTASLVREVAAWRWLADGPLVPSSGTAVATMILLATMAAFGAYGLLLLLTWRRPATPPLRRLLLIASTVLMALGVLSPPTASGDILDYVGFGRVAAVHGGNPYETGPAAYDEDPVSPFVSANYGDRPDNKLPAWQLLSEGLARIGGDSVVGLLVLYRLALFLFSLATLLLIDQVAGRLTPDHRLTAVAAWGLSPIVLLHGPAKTDAVMAMFLVAAIALIVVDRPAWAAPTFAASVFVKLLTAPMFAIWWIGELRQRHLRTAAVVAGLFVATASLMYLRYGGGVDLLIEHLALRRSDGPEGLRAIVTKPVFQSPVPTAILVVGVVGLGWHQNGDRLRLVRSFAVVGLYASALLTPRTFAWYLLATIAVVALSAHAWLLLGTFLLSGGFFLEEAFARFGSRAHPLPGVLDVQSHAATIVLPGIAVAAIAVLTALWRHRRGREGGSERVMTL